jgi:hypothetical protein
MSVLRSNWLPNCAMKRVIFHWTVGTYKANDFEKEHYHFLIEGDGTVVKGRHSIADNVSTQDGNYAAHVAGANTGSIGIAACCMAGARQTPFQGGSHPMTEVQFKKMAEVAAELCKFYQIEVTPRTVLGHGEVEINLGKPQGGKWDAMVTPWNTGLNITQVGDFFRTLVRNYMQGGEGPEEEFIKVKARIQGSEVSGALLTNGSSYLPIRDVASALGWTIPRAGDTDLDLVAGGKTHTLEYRRIGVDGYVSARALAQALGAPLGWDSGTRTVTIG